MLMSLTWKPKETIQDKFTRNHLIICTDEKDKHRIILIIDRFKKVSVLFQTLALSHNYLLKITT